MYTIIIKTESEDDVEAIKEVLADASEECIIEEPFEVRVNSE